MGAALSEKQEERPDGWCNLDDEGQIRMLLRRLRDYDAMADNLKATQERCGELLEDSRQKGRRIKALEAELEILREALADRA